MYKRQVKACDGNLHDKKYTEYSRLIVALSSIGKDARNVAGYDLTKALGDYDKTIWQEMCIRDRSVGKGSRSVESLTETATRFPAFL